MERLPAASLCRFGFEVVPDADGVRQRPADRDAEPDARDTQRRSREQIGQRHAGAQRSNGQDDRHHGLVDRPVVAVEQEQNADADIARAFVAQVVDARRDTLALAGVNEDAHARHILGKDRGSRRPGDAPPQHDDAQTRRRHLQCAGLLRRRNAGPHSTGLKVKNLAVLGNFCQFSVFHAENTPFYIRGLMAIISEWLKNDCADSITYITGVIQQCVKMPQSETSNAV